jgi:hypothetical protein
MEDNLAVYITIVTRTSKAEMAGMVCASLVATRGGGGMWR